MLFLRSMVAILLVLVSSCCSQTKCKSVSQPGGKYDGWSEQQKFERLTQIDIAYSRWCLYEDFGVLQPYSKIDLERLSLSRNPLAIIEAMKEAVNSIEKTHGTVDLKKLNEWRIDQIQAANVLKRELGKPTISQRSKVDVKSLLDMQAQDFRQLLNESNEIRKSSK